MRQRDVVGDAARQRQSFAAAFARHIGKAAAARPRRVVWLGRAPCMSRCGLPGLSAPTTPQQLALAGIGEAGDAEDLALAQREGDVETCALASERTSSTTGWPISLARGG